MADHHLPEREEQVAGLLRDAAERERAPEALRGRVDEMRGRRAARQSAATRQRAPLRGALLGRSPLSRSPMNVVSLVLPAMAALLIALVLIVGSGAGSPSIAQAAALAARGPAAPAPAPDPAAPAQLLSARVGELHFPNWTGDGGWRSVGQRRDRVGNRAVTTVYYAVAGQRIAYSIVSAPVLAGLSRGRPYMAMWRGGRTIVVWEQQGHTCVLSGAGISAERLWRLASTRHG